MRARGLLLISGSREEFDQDRLSEGMRYGLNYLAGRGCTSALVVEGDAPGTDRCCGSLADQWGLEHRTFPADWRTHGRAAGSLRNQVMVDFCRLLLHLGTAEHAITCGFPRETSVGTWDCLRRAYRARIPIWIQP